MIEFNVLFAFLISALSLLNIVLCFHLDDKQILTLHCFLGLNAFGMDFSIYVFITVTFILFKTIKA